MKTFDRAIREVSFAYENVSFFRKHMEDAGLSPADIRSPADMTRIPLTRKHHYRTNFPDGVLAKGVSLTDPFLYRSQSSGSEGERLITMAATYDLAARFLGCLEANPSYDFLGLGKYRTLRFAAPNCSDVECANPNTTMEDRILADGTLVLSVYSDLLTTPEEMMDRTLEEIDAHDAQLIYADPSHLAFLVRHMRKRGKTAPDVNGIVLTYTMPTAVSRRQIDEFFSKEIPCAEVSSMSEFGWLAMECQEGNMHMNSASWHQEFIVDGRAAKPGQLAELVLTSLGDKIAPHIRYATGDLYRLQGEKCACGNDSPIARLEGRASSMIVEGKRVLMTPRELDELVGRADWIDLYQLEQIGDGKYFFRYVGNEGATGDKEKELKGRLLEALGGRGRLAIERTSYIPAERSGKFFSCKSTVASRLAERHEIVLS